MREVGRLRWAVTRGVAPTILIVAAAVSLWAGIINARDFSVDFRLDAARALAGGTDPFEGAEGGARYLHILYVLLIPLAGLNDIPARLVFAAMNVGLGAVAVVVAARAFRLGVGPGVLLGLAFFASMPFRVTVGNAQTGLIVLAASSPLFLRKGGSGSALIGGASLAKWSFAPPLALWVALRRPVRQTLMFAVAPLAGFVVFGLLAGTLDPMHLLLPVLPEGSTLVPLGHADMMTLLRMAGLSEAAVVSVSAVIMATLSLVAVRGIRDERLAYAILLIISLMTVYHLSYDFVVLLPAAAAALSAPKLIESRIIAIIVVYFFFVDLAEKALRSASTMFGSFPESLTVFARWLDGAVRAPSAAMVAGNLIALTLVVVLLHRMDRLDLIPAAPPRDRMGPDPSVPA